MRIAMVCYHSCPLARLGERAAGGMSVYVRSLSRALGTLGHQVDVFTRSHDPADAPIAPLGGGARLVHVDAGPADAALDDLAAHLPAFTRGVEAFAAAEGRHYDVVHSHYWLSCGAGAALARAADARHAVTFHTLSAVKALALPDAAEPPERAVAERRAVAGADAIVVSDGHERDLLARCYGAPPAQVAVLPGGVDVDTFRPRGRDAARCRLGLGDGPVVLCVGRFDPLKRYDLALSAAALLEVDPPVEVLLVGGDLSRDPEAQRLSALASSLDIAGRVRFLGAVPHDELPWHYSAADAVLVPSLYESFGLVALEAMACGTPVIAARVGGLPSLVRDGETGYLAPQHTAEAYADRLEALLSHEGLRAAMGRAGRLRAQEFAWPAVGRRFADFYAGLAARQGAAR